MHGGGWVQACARAFQYWGPYLAARGIAMFSISYRLATKTKTFPEAVQDVLAGVQFLRGKAGAFGIDPARIGLLGASAGAHLAALAALGGKKFAGGYPQDPFAAVDAGVKALVGVYGIYDAVAMWTNYQVQGGRDNNFQKFMGASPMENRQLYFDASPISYATLANNAIGVLLVTGTEDDLVDRKVQTDPFQLALKQAGFFVRPVHRAGRAALLDERSDRRARQLSRLPGAAADALSGRTAVIAPPYFLSSSNVPSRRMSGWIVSASLANSHGSTISQIDAIVGDIDGAAHRLPERADAELQTVAGPGFLLNIEQMAVAGPHAAEAGFQAAHRLLFAEVMRDGNDERLRHDGSKFYRAAYRNGFAPPLFRRRALADRGVDRGHHFFGHQFHRSPRQRRIGPVHAAIEQRAEIADLLVQRQNAVDDAIDAAANDEIVENVIERHVVVRHVRSLP